MIAPLVAPALDNLLTQIEQHRTRSASPPPPQRALQVAGGQLPLGLVLYIVRSTRIANLDKVQAWRLAGTDGSIDVRFQPASKRNMTAGAAPGEPTAREQLWHYDQPNA